MAVVTYSTPGVYWVTTDITAPAGQDAICITSNFVTVILCSRLVCAGNSANTNCGVLVYPGLAGVNVIGQGGSINGFGFGVQTGMGGVFHTIDGVYVQNGFIRGVQAIGTDVLAVKNCNIQNIGGSTNSQNFYAIGIEVSGATNPGGFIAVKDNVITNITPNYAANLEAAGVSFSNNCADAYLMGNLIRNDNLAPPRADGEISSFGVWVSEGGNVRHIHNHFESWESGISSGTSTTGYINFNSFINCVYKGAQNNIFTGGSTVVVGAFNG